MKVLPILFAAGATVAVSLNPATAETQADTATSGKVLPVFLSTEALLGCKTQGPGEQESEVTDALLDAKSGQILGLIMESGVVASMDSVSWNADSKSFSCTEVRAQLESKPTEASSSPSSSQGADDEAANAGETFLLSSVLSLPIVGHERNEDEVRSEVVLGSVGGAFVEIESGHLAYVTTSVGGVLGIGADSRVIPWSAVTVQRDVEGDVCLQTGLSEKRLESAPEYGEGPDDLANPEYRNSLYSYYGSKRAQFEPEAVDHTGFVPVDQLLGADILRGENEDALKDLILDPANGQVTHALCEGGTVVPIEALRWDSKMNRFQVTGEAGSPAIDANAQRVLASTLAELDVMCEGQDCGDLEDIYFCTTSNKLEYFSLDRDGIRVLPWSTLSMGSTSEEPILNLGCPMARLEAAPELDGKVGASLYSPAFRARVDTLSKE